MGYQKVVEGEVNRTQSWRTEFSGKGLNVSRALAKLGNDVTLLTHINPTRTQELRTQADAEGFSVCLVEDPSQVRTCVTVLQDRIRRGMSTTELVQESPKIIGKDTESNVVRSFTRLTKDADCVIITGTRSPGYSSDLYPKMVQMAKEDGCFVILDVKRTDLTGSLKYSPDVIKPNLEELVQTFGACSDPVELIESLPCKAVITNGSNGCFIHVPGQELEHLDALRVQSRNTTGCGDAFTAAMADSLMRGLSLLDACQAGTRAGAFKAQEEPF
jgi:fructose-1-phosphate kinase PfkB-like protein